MDKCEQAENMEARGNRGEYVNIWSRRTGREVGWPQCDYWVNARKRMQNTPVNIAKTIDPTSIQFESVGTFSHEHNANKISTI